MIRTIAVLVSLLAAAGLVYADGAQKATLAAYFDLDGAAQSNTAVTNAEVISDALVLTLTAQPDTPRTLQAFMVDADASTTCTVTVVGTNANGTAITATAAIAAGAVALTPAYNFATVVSATLGTCAGEDGIDTVAIGTASSTIPVQYLSAYGSKKLNSQGINVKNPFEWRRDVTPLKVKTTGSSATVASYTTSSGALASAEVGRILLFVVNGEQYERVVVTHTSDNSVVVDEAIDLSSGTGHFFQFKDPFYGPDAEDGWIGVQGFAGGSVSFIFDVVQLGDNAHTFVQCEVVGAYSDPVQVDTDAITTTSTVVSTVDLRTTAYDRCRAGLQFDTTDAGGDAGTELEKINIYFVGTYPVIR